MRRLALVALIAAVLGISVGPAIAQAGPVRTLVIPISPSAEPITREQANDLVFGHVSGFIRRNSFGTVWLTGDTTPWQHSPLYDPSCSPLDAMLPIATDAARRAGYQPASYDRIAILHPTETGCRNGYAGLDVTPKAVLVNGLLELGSLAHELGHTFGLPHAGRFNGCPGNPAEVAHQLCVIYGDPYDVMGGPSSFGAYDAFEKFQAGWITNVTHAVADGEYTVEQLEQRSSLPQAFVVTTAGNEYWFDHREAVGDDARLGPSATGGLLVHVGTNPREPAARSKFRPSFFDPKEPVVNLLYTNPLGLGRDALIPGDTFGEPGAFELRVLAHAGTGVRFAFRWTDTTRPAAPRLMSPAKKALRRRPVLRWQRARELGSGVDHYEVRLDHGPAIQVELDAPRALALGRLGRGRHTVSVRAVDRAGNRGALAVRVFHVR